MNLEVEEFYTQGQIFYESGDYLTALELFKKTTSLQKDYAEAWLYAGIALLKMNRQAEAGIFLRRAELEYSKRIENHIQMDFNYYLRACVAALLHEKELLLSSLKEAVRLNPEYGEAALEEELFEMYREEDDFLEVIKPELDFWDAIRYKGNKLAKSDLDVFQLQNRFTFLTKLSENDWEIEDFEAMFESNISITPQAYAEFTKNESIHIALYYYVDEYLIFMELQNRNFAEDTQAYRLYKKENLESVLNCLIAFQDTVHQDNWEDLIEVLIEVCDAVLFEMPDGRKVKVS